MTRLFCTAMRTSLALHYSPKSFKAVPSIQMKSIGHKWINLITQSTELWCSTWVRWCRTYVDSRTLTFWFCQTTIAKILTLSNRIVLYTIEHSTFYRYLPDQRLCSTRSNLRWTKCCIYKFCHSNYQVVTSIVQSVRTVVQKEFQQIRKIKKSMNSNFWIVMKLYKGNVPGRRVHNFILSSLYMLFEDSKIVDFIWWKSLKLSRPV